MKKLVLGVALAATVFVGWRWRHATAVDAAGTDVAFNRFWIDHEPTSERDPFRIFIASIPEGIGGFADETAWHGEMERFRFDTDGSTIEAVFPWSGGREKITLHARACDEAGMDYCLEITGSTHGTARYYSRTGWGRKSVGELAAFRDELLSAQR